VVQNAPDTNQVRQLRSEISDPQLFCAREELGVGDGPVGLYVGSLYTAKRIPYLIEACDQLRTRLPDFHLIVIGDGPDRRFLNAAASTRPWVHVLGMRTRVEMVRYAALASIVLNPGLVGLSVLDAFALGLPMVTCDLTYHSPEIEYLKHGDNGLVLATETSAAAYGDAVATLLTNTAMLRRLSSGARLSAEVFTVEEMIERFAAGILTCLETPR
jgi:glycosyltransferase involved in cell wall biosynthesis